MSNYFCSRVVKTVFIGGQLSVSCLFGTQYIVGVHVQQFQ